MILRREDSIVELRAKKASVDNLLKVNEELRKQSALQQEQIIQTQLALCEIFESMQ